MKLLSTFCLAVLTTAKGQNLRSDEGKRRRRRLNTGAINTSIINQLATINAALQANLDDPSEPNTAYVGSFEDAACLISVSIFL